MIPSPEEVRPSLTYEGTTGFVKGSDTSQARAYKEVKRAGRVQGAVLQHIHEAEALGATSPEVEDLTGWKHQSVSAAIRNLERDGRLVKTVFIRAGCHAYVTKRWSYELRPEQLLAPNPTRTSWKREYEALLEGLRVVLASHEGHREPDLFAGPYDHLRSDLALLESRFSDRGTNRG